MSDNPYAPPSAAFESGQESMRNAFGLRLGASLFWRMLMLQCLLTIPLASIMPWPADFIIWKPTAICSCAAVVLFLGLMISRPGFLFLFWGHRLNLDFAAWRTFNWMATGYYFFMAAGTFALALSVPIGAWIGIKLSFPLLSLITFCAIAPRFLRKFGRESHG